MRDVETCSADHGVEVMVGAVFGEDSGGGDFRDGVCDEGDVREGEGF